MNTSYNPLADVLQHSCRCIATQLQSYSACIQCVYSVYTTILQLQRSCWHSYSQLIIQLSCNFKNTVNTAEFRIHTIILQLHTQLTPRNTTLLQLQDWYTTILHCIYNVITAYVCTAFIQHSYNSLTDVLQHCCNHIRIANTTIFAFIQVAYATRRVQCSYSVHTVFIQPSHSCKEVD